ncbi:uncharacterized protein ASCRUDRAFT_7363 [Ascoidea rubescens DSM 1968]|uniref:Uncharacterized protein n=1 Tax=Ascoidea rubescens DSM 1968 TaxID=1344418 RepID=A0A1D2VJX9_9ASCO|nr:hypothetical protein ASCRUDRAFT_7363 [Ascoidea rubescens DSM 1968]ODV61898.1 hypothetical protein ASCRUDRAFT_7363 [Ascoidea rubescens DSM 1968]
MDKTYISILMFIQTQIKIISKPIKPSPELLHQLSTIQVNPPSPLITRKKSSKNHLKITSKLSELELKKILLKLNRSLQKNYKYVFLKQANHQISLQILNFQRLTQLSSIKFLSSSLNFMNNNLDNLLNLNNQNFKNILLILKNLPNPIYLSSNKLFSKTSLALYKKLRLSMNLKRIKLIQLLQKLQFYKNLIQLVKDNFNSFSSNMNGLSGLQNLQNNLITSQSTLSNEISKLRITLSQLLPKLNEKIINFKIDELNGI